MKERPKKTLWQEFKKNPSLYIGLFLVFVLLLMAFFPSLFTSLSPTDIVAEAKLSPPSKEHIFGTDVYGRDVFARCVYGTIVDLKIGVIAMIVPLIMGTIIGLLAGYYGGKFDMIVMRIVDIFIPHFRPEGENLLTPLFLLSPAKPPCWVLLRDPSLFMEKQRQL